MSRPVITLKCGGSVITDESAIPRVVAETRRWIDEGWQVVLVGSAIGETTNRLIGWSGKVLGGSGLSTGLRRPCRSDPFGR